LLQLLPAHFHRGFTFFSLLLFFLFVRILGFQQVGSVVDLQAGEVFQGVQAQVRVFKAQRRSVMVDGAFLVAQFCPGCRQFFPNPGMLEVGAAGGLLDGLELFAVEILPLHPGGLFEACSQHLEVGNEVAGMNVFKGVRFFCIIDIGEAVLLVTIGLEGPPGVGLRMAAMGLGAR